MNNEYRMRAFLEIGIHPDRLFHDEICFFIFSSFSFVHQVGCGRALLPKDMYSVYKQQHCLVYRMPLNWKYYASLQQISHCYQIACEMKRFCALLTPNSRIQYYSK